MGTNQLNKIGRKYNISPDTTMVHSVGAGVRYWQIRLTDPAKQVAGEGRAR